MVVAAPFLEHALLDKWAESSAEYLQSLVTNMHRVDFESSMRKKNSQSPYA